MYRLEWLEENRWMRWQVRLIGMAMAVDIVYYGLKWLYHLVF